MSPLSDPQRSALLSPSEDDVDDSDEAALKEEWKVIWGSLGSLGSLRAGKPELWVLGHLVNIEHSLRSIRELKEVRK